MPTFDQLGLIPELVEAVVAKGYAEPTPIQAKAIPAVLEGRDVMGGAQTGTGKTAAFALPILQKQFQCRSKDRAPRALVLAPTRELAVQVEEGFCSYGKGLGIHSVAIYGGVKMPPQVSRLRRGVGVVVATPGRLLDHVGQRTLDLSKIEILVLDEADRMLDMGFMPDIRRIIERLPARRQNLMFSATYSSDIRRMAGAILRDPMSIEVARRNTAAEGVEQVVHPVLRSRKRELLSKLIADGDWRQVLVFSRTRIGADRLAKQLRENGARAVAIHGDKTQAMRTRALEDFKRGAVRVLVATDVASRGLDIRQLPHVVNFELPDAPEDYVHRIGRTGRAGDEGAAHSLVCNAERGKLAEIEKLLAKRIPRVEIEGFEGENISFSGPPPPSRSGSTKSRRGWAGGKRSSSARGGSGKGKTGSAKRKKPVDGAAPPRKHKPKWSEARKRDTRTQRGAGGEVTGDRRRGARPPRKSPPPKRRG